MESTFFPSVFSLFDVFGSFAGWVWTRPAALVLLCVLLFAFLLSRRCRETLVHGAPWLFAPSPLAKAAAWLLRTMSVSCVLIALGALILALASPIRMREKKEPAEHRPALAYVMDVSGSMDGAIWRRLSGFLQEFMARAENASERDRIAVGIYYFSSDPLLNVYPTHTYRLVRDVVKRFSTKSYGAGLGTEAAPSLWIALSDLVRTGNPDLSKDLLDVYRLGAVACASRSGNGLGRDMTHVIIQTKGETFLRLLKAAVRGKRLVIGTDTEFMVNRTYNPCVLEVFRFAQAIGLPIDIVSTGPVSGISREFFPRLVRETGGVFYQLSTSSSAWSLEAASMESVERAAADVYQSLAKSAVWVRETTTPVIDHSPERALILVALCSIVLWLLMHAFRPIVGW